MRETRACGGGARSCLRVLFLCNRPSSIMTRCALSSPRVRSLHTHALPWHPKAGSLAAPLQSAYLNPCDVTLIRRIGSPSANGVVYDVAWPMSDHHGALKIMIPGEEAAHEISVATHLSSLVRHDRATRFPQVYTTATCDDTRIDIATPFGSDLRDRHLRRRLADEALVSANVTDRDKTRIRRAWRYMTFTELGRHTEEATVKAIMSSTSYTSTVMVSEILYSDVNYLIRHPSRPLAHTSFFAHIIAQCVQCLIEMFRVRAVHGDVHFGNFLLRKTGADEVFVLIHDFGTSRLDCHDHAAYMFDLAKLMDNVRNNGAFPEAVDSSLQIIDRATSMDSVEEAMCQVMDLFESRDDGSRIDIATL